MASLRNQENSAHSSEAHKENIATKAAVSVCCQACGFDQKCRRRQRGTPGTEKCPRPISPRRVAESGGEFQEGDDIEERGAIEAMKEGGNNLENNQGILTGVDSALLKLGQYETDFLQQ